MPRRAAAPSPFFDPRYGDGRAQQWNLNVQRQFGYDFLGEVAYAGSKGEHLALKTDINAPPTVGMTNRDVNRPFIAAAPRCVACSNCRAAVGPSIMRFTASSQTELPA
jgi:hypothetical protein